MHQRVLHYGKGSGNALSPWRVCVCVCVSTCLVARSSSRIRCITDEAHGFHGAQDFWVHRRRSSVGKKKKSNFPNIKFIVTTQCFDWIQGFDWSLKGSVLKHQFEPQIKQTSNQTRVVVDKTKTLSVNSHSFISVEMNWWTHELMNSWSLKFSCMFNPAKQTI